MISTWLQHTAIIWSCYTTERSEHSKPPGDLKEDNLKEIFKINPVIGQNPVTGTPFLFVCDDIRKKREKLPDLFLISGGGSGACLMSVLVSAGYQVKCGVLSENDSDCQVAKRYGLEVIYQPFIGHLFRFFQGSLIQ